MFLEQFGLKVTTKLLWQIQFFYKKVFGDAF